MQIVDTPAELVSDPERAAAWLFDNAAKPEWVRHLESKGIAVKPDVYNPDNPMRAKR